jgi:outer membrane protein assembly factor BamB
MKLSNTRAIILKNRRFDNWESEVEGRWSIEDLRADEAYCHEWISFDCLAWDGKSNKLYIGLTSINNDIFYTYDPTLDKFMSLGFQAVGDRFDAKLHRSLEIDDDGLIYAATALLHDMDQQREAKGGKLLQYDPLKNSYKILAIPVPAHYIQSILLDRKRRVIYGFTYPAEYIFRYDIASGASQTLAYIGNSVMMCQPHCASFDKYGRLWGTWGENRAFEDMPGPVPVRLFCYDPDQDQFTWFKHGFPKTHQADPARVDHMLLAHDGTIYVGTVAGGFSRLDPERGEVEDLGKPFPGPRLAGLVQGPDGLIYGAGNAGYGVDGKGEARMFAFDPENKRLTDLGPIFDESIGAGAVKIHMLAATADGTLYAGENDNILRSSYLWECRVTR